MGKPQGPFRFVLDIGANRSVLAEHMLAKLGLTLFDATLSVEISGATPDVQTGALVLAPQIRFKGVEITGLK